MSTGFKWMLTLFCLIFSCPWGARVIGQSFPPAIDTYSPEDYQAHQQIFCAAKMPDGRAVFGTAEEVLVYNGEVFKKIGVGKGKHIYSLDVDRSGRIFLGGSTAMGVITPDSSGSLSYRSLVPLLPDSLQEIGMVWNTYCGPEGRVYFNAYKHLFVLEKDSLRTITPKKEKFFLMHPVDGTPIVQDIDTGLWRLKGMKREQLAGMADWSEDKSVMGVHSTVSGKSEPSELMIFTRTSGVYRYSPQKGKVRKVSDTQREKKSMRKLQEAEIYTTARLDPRKNPYGAAYGVGTNLRGVYLLGPKGKILIHISRDEGIPSNGVWDLVAGRHGNIWVTTDQGISFLHTGSPFTLAKEGELFKGGAMDLSRFPSSASGKGVEGKSEAGPLMLASLRGTWYWDERKGKFTAIEGMGGHCSELLKGGGKEQEGAEPYMVVAADKEFVIRKTGPDPLSFKVDTAFPKQALSLASLPYPKGMDGSIAVVTREGLFIHERPLKEKLENEKDTLLTVDNLLAGSKTLSYERMTKDPDSLRIWVGSLEQGAMAVTIDTGMSGYRVEEYDTSDGLPKGPVRIFKDEKRNKMIFGTSRGIYEFREERFRPSCDYTQTFCKSELQIFRFRSGTGKDLWVNDAQGGLIKHLIPKEGGFRIDSLPFRALDIGSIREIHPEEERTWFGGDEGIACYHPNVEKKFDISWNCFISKVKGPRDTLLFGGDFGKTMDREGQGVLDRRPVDEQPQDMVPKLAFSHNRLKFHYAARFPDRPDLIQYKTRLVGFDTSWSKWSKEAKKEYTSLREGTYTFKVKARNVYKKESSTAEFRFTILPPWYRTWTAYAGYSIAGVLLFWLLVRLNSRRLMHQKRELEKQVDERTQEIQEKNKNLEAANEEISRQKQEVEQAHQEITDSITYAKRIQSALLQAEEDVSKKFPEHFILFKPRSTVSGDFYWAKEQGGAMYFAAVDCTGHGVPGAFMSLLGVTFLNDIMANQEAPEPGDILNRLRERVVSELSGSSEEAVTKDGMDAAIIRIPLDAGEQKRIRFAGAKNPLYVVPGELIEPDEDRVRTFKRSGSGIEIRGDRMAVGYEPEAMEDFTTAEVEVKKGEMLYIFSDGYADQFGGPMGKKFRYKPFQELLLSIHEKDPGEQKKILEDRFEQWKDESDQEQIDDVLVMGIRL